ncbi:MAG TPA: hypothetical protein VGK01_20725, partial [Candidatus Angelobacter sp.]
CALGIEPFDFCAQDIHIFWCDFLGRGNSDHRRLPPSKSAVKTASAEYNCKNVWSAKPKARAEVRLGPSIAGG